MASSITSNSMLWLWVLGVVTKTLLLVKAAQWHDYFVSFAETAPTLYNPSTGYVYMTCWDAPCYVEVTKSTPRKKTDRWVIDQYQFKTILSSTHLVLHVNEVVKLPTAIRIRTKQNITMTCGTWDGRFYYHDTFSLYPILDTDVDFVVTLSNHLIKFVAFISRATNTQVSITYLAEGDSSYQNTTVLVEGDYTFYLFFTDGSWPTFTDDTGLVVRASAGIAVFCGDDVTSAQLRPQPSEANGLVYVAATDTLKPRAATLTAISNHDGETDIEWSTQDGDGGDTTLNSTTWVASCFQVQIQFKTLIVRCSSPASVALSYQLVGEIAGKTKTAIAFLLPTTSFTSTYILCVPYYDERESKNHLTRQTVALIAREGDIRERILVNGNLARESVSSPVVPVWDTNLCAVNFNQTEKMVFTVSQKHSHVRFAIFLYHQGTNGIYFSEATGFDHHTADIDGRVQDKPSSTLKSTTSTSTNSALTVLEDPEKGEQVHNAYKMFFGIFVPCLFGVVAVVVHARCKTRRERPPSLYNPSSFHFSIGGVSRSMLSLASSKLSLRPSKLNVHPSMLSASVDPSELNVDPSELNDDPSELNGDQTTFKLNVVESTLEPGESRIN